MKKRILIFGLIIAIAVATPGVASAIEYSNGTTTVNGSLSVDFIFTAEETPVVLQWLENFLQSAIEALHRQISETSDPAEIAFLRTALENSLNTDVESLFAISADGSSVLSLELPYLDIKMSEVLMTSDIEGEFSATMPRQAFSRAQNGVDVSISCEGITLTTEKVAIDADGTVDITLIRTLDDMSNAVERMGSAMVQSQSVYMPSYFFGFGPIAYPIYVAAGSTRFFTSSGIVGCNKCDTTLTASGFPFNNSDCTNATAAGLFYLSNPVTYAAYSMGYNCVIEAMQQVDDPAKRNVYCNGDNKSGRYNCSWFTGVGHTEQLHTHDGSNTVYYS